MLSYIIHQYLHPSYSDNILITKVFQITFALREGIFRMTKGRCNVTKYKLRGFIFKLPMENQKLGVVAHACNASTQKIKTEDCRTWANLGQTVNHIRWLGKLGIWGDDHAAPSDKVNPSVVGWTSIYHGSTIAEVNMHYQCGHCCPESPLSEKHLNVNCSDQNRTQSIT